MVETEEITPEQQLEENYIGFLQIYHHRSAECEDDLSDIKFEE